jgi:hypothetical protein
VVDEQSVRDENGNIGEAGGSFPGVRFLYDLLDGAGHLSGYQAALDLLGFDNEASPTVVSPLCSGAQNFERAAIASAGYAPLNTTGGGSHNQAHSSCRLLP